MRQVGPDTLPCPQCSHPSSATIECGSEGVAAGVYFLAPTVTATFTCPGCGTALEWQIDQPFDGFVAGFGLRLQVATPEAPGERENDTGWSAIREGLVGEMTSSARLAALRKYVDVGMSKQHLDKAIGKHCRFVEFGQLVGGAQAPDSFVAEYGRVDEPRLAIRYSAEGEVESVCFMSGRGRAMAYIKNGEWCVTDF